MALLRDSLVISVVFCLNFVFTNRLLANGLGNSAVAESNLTALPVANDTEARFGYFGVPLIYDYNSQQNVLPDAVNYFANRGTCNGTQDPLPLVCQHQLLTPQCAPRARQLICKAYTDASLTNPERLNAAPATFANITWPTGVTADLGNSVTTPQVKDAPVGVNFAAKPYSFYTILLVDAGQPGVTSPTRPVNPVHWFVGNIPGSNVADGETIFGYFPLSTPTAAPMPVIYNLFVYEQPGQLPFDEPRLEACSFSGRVFFSSAVLKRKYNLMGPQYGNFVRLANLPAGDQTNRNTAVSCIPAISEKFRQANIPYSVQSGLTLTWPNNNILGFGNILRPFALGTQQPQVFSFQTDPAQKFSVILLNLDANNNNEASSPKYVNWLVVNIGQFRTTLVGEGTPIVEYQRPAPQNDGKAHRFVGLLYLQPNGMIETTNLSRVQRCDIQSRAQYDVDSFVKKNNLQLVEGAFALMRFDGTQPC